MTKKVSMFLMCLTAATLLSSPVLGAAFIKFDGVDGESSDANHDKWSDVLSLGQAARLEEIDLATKKKESFLILSPRLEPIRISKEIDKAGIKLAEALLEGRIFPRVEIELTANYGGSRATYLRYELKNVQVTAYDINASGNEASPPTESVQVDFGTIKVTYTEYDSEGNKKGQVEYEYDKTQNE